MNNTLKKVLATLLMLTIFAGVFASLPATETEAASTVSRMSLIKQVVTAMEKAGATLQKGTSKEISAYKKQFSTTKTNAKYIAKAINAGIMTKTQWKSIKTKITYTDMYKMLVKADEYVWGEWVSDEQAKWIYVSIFNVTNDYLMSDADKLTYYRAFILGYAERYIPLKENEYNYLRPCIKLNAKPSTKVVKKAVALLVKPDYDWYTAFIPDTVQLKGTTPAQAYCQRVLETKPVFSGAWGDVLYFRPNVTVKAEWSSSNEKIVTVDENGLMTGKKAGIATITCKIRNNVYSNTVTVKEPETIDEFMASLGARKALTICNSWDPNSPIGERPATKDIIQLDTFRANASGRIYPHVVGQGYTFRSTAKDINTKYSKYEFNFTETDGYEWLVFPLFVSVGGMGTDSAYVDDGIKLRLITGFFDMYNRVQIDDGDGKDSQFTLEWNGKKWDKCEYHGRADYVDGGSLDLEFFFKVPKGYDGLVLPLGEYETYKGSEPSVKLKNCQIYVNVCAE